jgi:hypothetical protein
MKMPKKAMDFLKTVDHLKKNVSHYLEENDFSEIQDKVKSTLKTARTELKNITSKDLHKIKKKFESEKKQIEKVIDKVILVELKKARSFIENQKNEINKIQTHLEKIIKKSKAQKTTGKKKTTRRAPVAKKTKRTGAASDMNSSHGETQSATRTTKTRKKKV